MSTTAATATLKNKSLQPKENALFKRILKCYEQKLYKNGLKFAKQILSNPQYSEHAETLAMKGLILNAIGRREEAYEYVRRGLRNDLRSHTCWHVYGLLQRSERRYEEAIKCYRNALKWDPTNLQILRELSIVQIHQRDMVGYRDTRNQLFSLKPAQRASWIGFAMAYHLLDDFKMASRLLEEFKLTQTQVRDSYDYENSELLLYQCSILEESGATQAAISLLRNNDKYIYDKNTLLETYGRLYLQAGELSEAQIVYDKLIRSNPDNVSYFHALEKSMGIEEVPEKRLELYRSYEEKFPRAILPRRLALDCTSGEQFLALLRPYMESTFAKGVPPLFTDLRTLYKDHNKAKIIENLVENMVAQLEKHSKFTADADEEAPASALVWAYYYLAQHYDYYENSDVALKYIDKAILHTPTLIELFMVKAKILKHAGEFDDAADVMDEARELDTADRYLNSKSAKYHLRANRVETATSVCGKFTREGSNPMENLNEMQCMWFQTECALAYQRSEKWGDALKKCHEVDRHFHEIVDDQYDFHTYCLRKMTLKSYVQLLRLEDYLPSHQFYFKAAKCGIEVYLHLHDTPLKSKSDEEQIITESLSASDLKKLLNKQRKAKKKAELEQQALAAVSDKKEQHTKSSKQNNTDDEYHSPLGEELVPEKLERHPHPILQASKFLGTLEIYSPNRLETHLLAYEIYKRKDKPVLMLRSLKRALKLSPNNPHVTEFLVHFRETIDKRLESLPEPLPEFLRKEMEIIYESVDIQELTKSLKYVDVK